MLPNNIDIDGHMNNGRCLTMIDLMIVEYFVRVGFASAVIKRGWRRSISEPAGLPDTPLMPFGQSLLTAPCPACA